MHPTAPSAHRAILIGSIGMGDRDRLERLIGIAGMLNGCDSDPETSTPSARLALSWRKQGFESPRERQYYQSLVSCSWRGEIFLLQIFSKLRGRTEFAPSTHQSGLAPDPVSCSGSRSGTGNAADLHRSQRHRQPGRLRPIAEARKATIVEGHTDGKGTDSYNQSLSERRAAAVPASGTASAVMVMSALPGKLSPNTSRRICVRRSPLRTSVMNTVI
jgi:hypothetical protein